MKPEDFLKTTLTDIKIKISEEFDKNFERKAFFDQKWRQSRFFHRKGSLMIRTGKLRRSIQSKITKNGIRFTSAMPYADIHNNGGEITVTEKMKRFFWAMYYKSAGAIKTTKTGKISQSGRNEKLRAEALGWKALALKKIGSKIKIEPRQFIGHHPQIDTAIREIVNKNLKELEIKPWRAATGK